MTKTFTQNDVLKYFYNEVSKLEKEQIEDFLSCNEVLRSYYKGLLDTESVIDQNLARPSDLTVSNILNYSKSLCTGN